MIKKNWFMHNVKSIFIVTLLSIMVLGCSEDDNEVTITSIAKVTVDGTTIDYSVKNASYSYITKLFTLELKKDAKLLNLFFRADDLSTFTSGEFDTSCGFASEMVTNNFLGSTIYSTTTSTLEITKVEKTNETYTISGLSNNLELKGSGFPNDELLTVTSIEFSALFTIKSKEELDYISFTANNSHTFYGNKASGYISPYFFPNPSSDEVELILASNTVDQNPRQISAEGISIIDISPTYPPIVETITGYDEGLRLSVILPEVDNCLNTNLVFYDNGNNQIENFNSTVLEITDVEEQKDSYALFGTFSGKITQDGGDYIVLTISNGTFKVSVPKL